MDFTVLADPLFYLKLFATLLAVVILVGAIVLFIRLLLALWKALPGWLERRVAAPRTSAATWGDMLKTGEFAAIADWFIWRFTLFGVVGVVGAGAAAWVGSDYKVGLRVFALSLLLGAASTGAGWLLGLLFGVPRTLARGQATAPAPAAPQPGAAPAANAPPGSTPQGTPPVSTSSVNTNLEDISDWLTKTIVGVGLTQLYATPHFLWRTAGQLNKAGFGWEPHGQLLALSLFVYFATGGFWLGYVGTRTVLTKLLKQIDEVPAYSEDRNSKKLEAFLFVPNTTNIDLQKQNDIAAAMTALNIANISVAQLVWGPYAAERAKVAQQLGL